MSIYTDALGTRKTPQSEPIPGREAEMAANNAEGVTFVLDKWGQLRRFLILGTEEGTFYAGARDHTLQAGKNLRACLEEDGARFVDEVVSVSTAGLAPKNDPCLFALALAAKTGDVPTRELANQALPQVGRIGTHLFQYLGFVKALGGWGRGTRKAIARWYLEKEPSALAYQLVKYRQRDGWSHRDALRLAHPEPTDEVFDALFQFATRGTVPKGGPVESAGIPQIVAGFQLAQEAETAEQTAALIREHRLTREMVRTEHLADLKVQEALLERMPMGAMIRNLGNFTKSGLLTPLSDAEQTVVDALSEGSVRKAKVHPLNVLLALKTYAGGKGLRGSGSWKPSQRIVDALDKAFAASFDNVEPTGRAWYLGIDVSSSMGWESIAGKPLTAAEAAAAVAMVVARTESRYVAMGFASGNSGFRGAKMRDLGISAADSFAAVLERTRRMNFGGTDCALPMVDALERGIKVDVFVILTDNETWAGNIQPSQALEKYRREVNPEARLAVLAFTSTGFTIADPRDAGMMDFVGLDASLPVLLAAFAKGEV